MRGPLRWVLASTGVVVGFHWVTIWGWDAIDPVYVALSRAGQPLLWVLVYLLPAAWVGGLALWEGHGKQGPMRRRWLPAAALFAAFALAPWVVGAAFVLFSAAPELLSRAQGAPPSSLAEAFMGLLFVPPAWGLEVLVALGWTGIVLARRLLV